MPIPTHVDASIQLLVEGNDQRNFFRAIVHHMGICDIQIQNFGGVNELRDFLVVLVNQDDFSLMVKSVGIVRDAEESARSAFQSVQSSLANAGLNTPTKPRERVGDSPGVSVLILPDDNRPGMLETLLCETFADAEINGCIDVFFDCAHNLPEVDMRRSHKSRAHAYISTQPEPQSSVGVAAQKGYWNLDHSALANVRSFLNTL